jgi:hypothetical protein
MVRKGKKVEDRPRARARVGVEVEGDGYDVPVFQIGCVDYLNNITPKPTRSTSRVFSE